MGTDGTYALTNLPTGDYVVEFYAVGYMSEYYNNVTSSVSATTVHVTAGATTAGIDAVLTAGIASVPNPATVSGRVVDLDGNGSRCSLPWLAQRRRPLPTVATA